MQLVVIIGHAVYLLSLKTEMLCLLHSRYRFVTASYQKFQRPWNSVIDELTYIIA